MKTIKVIKDKNIAVVTATSDFNPLNSLALIGDKLAVLKFSGFVVIDLLARNGMANNRFVKISFDGKRFDRSSLAVLTDLDDELKNDQNKAFRKNRDFLETTVLASQEIKEFLVGKRMR